MVLPPPLCGGDFRHRYDHPTEAGGYFLLTIAEIRGRFPGSRSKSYPDCPVTGMPLRASFALALT